MCRHFAAVEAVVNELPSAPRMVRVCLDFPACPHPQCHSHPHEMCCRLCAMCRVLLCFGGFVQRGRGGDAQQVRREGDGPAQDHLAAEAARKPGFVVLQQAPPDTAVSEPRPPKIPLNTPKPRIYTDFMRIYGGPIASLHQISVQ